MDADRERDDPLARTAAARGRAAAAAVEFWNARLELLAATGDLRALLTHLQTPVEAAGDNCNCNAACNIGCATNLLNPARPTNLSRAAPLR